MSASGPQPTYPPSLINEYTIAIEGSSVACVLLGVYLVFAGFNLALLRKKRYHILLTYSIVQLVFTVLYFGFALYAVPAQSLGIFNISDSYTPDALSPWPSVVVNVLFVLNTWASDAFLLYRCYVVCAANLHSMAFPALLYIATLTASVAWLVVSSLPGAVYSTHAVQIAGICFWSCTAAMNVCTSCFIVIRLWFHRRTLVRALGPQHGSFYFGYMAMTLESASLYTVFVIIALVVFVLNSPLENVFFPVLGTVQAIAPSLIIYRIARGIAFATDKSGALTAGSLRFASSTVRPRRVNVPKAVRHDISDGSGTMRASCGSSIKTDEDHAHSLADDVVKEDV